VKPALAALLGFLAIAPALAAEGARVTPLADPVLEARAHSLERELRCVVCQGQSLAESNATLAADLRKLIRDRIAAGESNAQIKDFLVTRYGDFILMKPPLREDTFLLWFGPLLLVVLGGGIVAVIIARARRRPLPAEDALVAEED
jgi:cytochrome c-type biogenesis protein CcmH